MPAQLDPQQVTVEIERRTINGFPAPRSCAAPCRRRRVRRSGRSNAGQSVCRRPPRTHLRVEVARKCRDPPQSGARPATHHDGGVRDRIRYVDVRQIHVLGVPSVGPHGRVGRDVRRHLGAIRQFRERQRAQIGRALFAVFVDDRIGSPVLPKNLSVDDSVVVRPMTLAPVIAITGTATNGMPAACGPGGAKPLGERAEQRSATWRSAMPGDRQAQAACSRPNRQSAGLPRRSRPDRLLRGSRGLVDDAAVPDEQPPGQPTRRSADRG